MVDWWGENRTFWTMSLRWAGRMRSFYGAFT